MNFNYNGGNRLPAILSVLIVISILGMVYFYNYFYQGSAGMEQPVPFSHRLHTGVKDIGCVMCHEGVLKTARAGIPPLETCMLCHQSIIIHYPHIQKVRESYSRKEPVKWIKVYSVPDFVNFDHSAHTAKGVDCGRCHGNVKGMDRIIEVNKFEMGFCIQCHRDNRATIDCLACHY